MAAAPSSSSSNQQGLVVNFSKLTGTNQPTVHVVVGITTTESGNENKKKALWKRVFHRKKGKNSSREELHLERQNLLQTDRSKILIRKASTDTAETLDAANACLNGSCEGIYKNYQTIPSTSSSQLATPEPILRRSSEHQIGPLQIAWPDSNTTGLTINVKPICKLLSKLGDLPVAIFSINGTTRGGKSFLLNQAVKYLKFGKSHPNDWIDQDLDISFDWSFRMESVTEGIDIWPEPFILESEDGKKVGLILMDNQGLEDVHTTTHVAYKLFCLSNLLSSVFTYCDTQAYTKNYLDSLHTFMEFSKSVEHDGRRVDKRKENLAYTFGKLILLFRDFRFVKEFPCEDGCSFYDKNTSTDRNLYSQIFHADHEKVSKVVREKRTALLKFYDDVLISTMIGPGNKEPNNTDRLHSSTWDPDFKTGVMKFIEKVFTFEFMSDQVKKISGSVVPAQKLAKYVKNWAKVITEKNYDIGDITGLEASRNIYYEKKIEESMKLYMETIDGYKFNPANGDIGEILVKTIKSIETEFWTDCEFGDWREFYLEKLQTKISAYSNEQSILLHCAISEKRKNKKLTAKLAGFTGTAVMIGGTITAFLTNGVVVIVGILLATSGGVIFVSGAVLLAYLLWIDRRERNAVRQISTKVDSKFGKESHFDFKGRLRQMKMSRKKNKCPNFLKVLKFWL